MREILWAAQSQANIHVLFGDAEFFESFGRLKDAINVHREIPPPGGFLLLISRGNGLRFTEQVDILKLDVVTETFLVAESNFTTTSSWLVTPRQPLSAVGIANMENVLPLVQLPGVRLELQRHDYCVGAPLVHESVVLRGVSPALTALTAFVYLVVLKQVRAAGPKKQQPAQGAETHLRHHG